MDDHERQAQDRRNRLFELLKQQQAGKSPAEKAALAAARYLDDTTAQQIQGRAITSLTTVRGTGKNTTKLRSFSLRGRGAR